VARSWIRAQLRRATPERVLAAIRIAGTGVVGALGQLVVDMPDGYFGAAEQITFLGLVYAGAIAGAMALLALGTLLGWRPVRFLFPPLVLLGTAFFLPALATDVVAAGAIVGWQLSTLSRVVFAGVPGRRRVRSIVLGSPLRAPVVHLLTLSIFCTTLIVGFELTDVGTARLACGLLDAVAITGAILTLPRDRRLQRWLLISGVAIVLALAIGQSLASVLATLGIVQLGLLAIAVVEGPIVRELMHRFVARPALLVLGTFAVVALSGAVALTFPAAAEHERIAPIDALFTSMSATCVTGLSTIDTPNALSTFGEIVLLIVIQVGGLGIMVLSTFATVILGGRLTLRGERALESVLDLGSTAGAYRLVRFIVLSTLAIEAAGALVLAVCYVRHGFPVGESLYRGLFQSVSAFCNAGFSLHSDSIIMFQSDPLALFTHGALLVLGGLGFVVLAWIWSRTSRQTRARAPVQVRVVFGLTAFFIAAGAIGYGLLEWNHTLDGLSTSDKLWNAWFQGVTPRTAGFNSVDFSTMQPATILFLIVLMFIGAAPGGTAGGIKITTVAVLAAAIPEIVGTRAGAMLFGREIPAATLQRAATIAVVATTTMVLALFLLLITEDAPFEVLAFETVSALGTVGLSLGITPQLSAAGKWIIIVTMFIGRVGPLTLALALGERVRPRIHYPETRIMVG
jgi:trk system potassium uptake protein TrkH